MATDRSSRRKKSQLIRTVILIAIAIAVFLTGEKNLRDQAKENPTPTSERNQASDLEHLEGVRLIEDRGNDGDSFLVSYRGEVIHLRLYYVDAPEKYLSDRYPDQRERVAEQGRELGGLTPEQTVDLGKRARAHVTNLLRGKPFSVYTKWEPVYNSERRYGFVQIPGTQKLLGEELIEQGLARIHTQGTTTPAGTSFYEFRDHLEYVEGEARKARRGAWGLN